MERYILSYKKWRNIIHTFFRISDHFLKKYLITSSQAVLKTLKQQNNLMLLNSKSIAKYISKNEAIFCITAKICAFLVSAFVILLITA